MLVFWAVKFEIWTFKSIANDQVSRVEYLYVEKFPVVIADIP